MKGTRVTVDSSILGNLNAGVDEAELPLLFPVLRDKARELSEIIDFARQ